MRQGFVIALCCLVLSTIALRFATSSNQSGTTSKEPTFSDKIKTLEDNGTIPKLDRSADIKGPDKNNNGVRG